MMSSQDIHSSYRALELRIKGSGVLKLHLNVAAAHLTLLQSYLGRKRIKTMVVLGRTVYRIMIKMVPGSVQ